MALRPLVINIDPTSTGYTRILGGPPNSKFMRSGNVVLNSGESVGEHSTESNEEIIFVLEGNGQFLVENNLPIDFDENSVLYCPPMTIHNILNTGSTPLRYIYVVSKAK